jgi:hypothetical protein
VLREHFSPVPSVTPAELTAICGIDTPVEIEYFRDGGNSAHVLRNTLKKG